jgi:hypothetical protein
MLIYIYIYIRIYRQIVAYPFKIIQGDPLFFPNPCLALALPLFSASDSQSDHNSGPEEAAASKPGEPPDIVKSSANLNRRGRSSS